MSDQKGSISDVLNERIYKKEKFYNQYVRRHQKFMFLKIA